MTTTHLKLDGEWVMGKNGKKLRYLYDKVKKTIILKVPDNWGENAFDDITDKYEGFVISFDTTTRGRPKTQENHDIFNMGDRVKADDKVGIIIDIIGKKAKIEVDGCLVIHDLSDIKKARGRKAKKKLTFEKPIDEDLLEILKYDGEMYLINNIREVMTMSGDYVGLYENGEITN